MAKALARHDDIIESAVVQHGGELLKSHGEGDATFSVFGSPSAAIRAAAWIQDMLDDESWPTDGPVRVRLALHTGEADLRGGDFFGPTVNRCARLRSIAHGGQTLCSQSTAELVTDFVPEGLRLEALGVHRLKDLSRLETVFQVCRQDRAETFPPLRSVGAPQRKLPVRRTSFVGREDEVRTITAHVDSCRLVTLTGVGGAGKTRLALEVAERLEGGVADTVVFADLSPVSEPAGMVPVIASALGAELPEGGGAGEVARTVGDRRVLIVLDNCEHLLDACAEAVEVLLDACPNLRVLATSREALGVAGEQKHAVGPLGLDTRPGLRSEAAQLFVERARAARDDLELSSVAESAIEEIAVRLDGIPLAIELAAAQVEDLSPAQILEHLHARLSLQAGGRGLGRRQHTLAAALDWSHDLLDDRERVMFRRLSVFAGDFRADAAAEICGFDVADPTSILRALIRKSLVVSRPGELLGLRMLETVRMYAGEQLSMAGEAGVLADRHRDWYLAWLESLDDDDYYAGRPLVLAEHHNLRAALQWSNNQGRLDLVARMATLMPSVWDTIDPVDGLRWLDLALERTDDLDDDVLLRLLQVRAFMSIAALEPDCLERSQAWLERAEALAGDAQGFWPAAVQGLLCLNLSWPAVFGEPVKDKIEHRGRRGLELATSPGARLYCLLWLGHARIAADDLAGAIEATQAARSEARLIHSFWEPYINAILSMILHVSGDLEGAARAAVSAAAPELSEDQGNAVLYERLMLPLSYAASGKPVDALELLTGMVHDAPSEPAAGTTASLVNVLAAIRALNGEWETAAVLLGAVLSAFLAGAARSPADVALRRHYEAKTRAALGDRFDEHFLRGTGMTLSDALAHGL